MSNNSHPANGAQSVEDSLRAELAQGDVILATARPILRHLLANDDHALFSDEVIAKIRGMMLHIARQLLFEVAEKAGEEDRTAFTSQHEEGLAQNFLEDTAFLAHAHALTIEAQLADRLQQRSDVDGVLSPLLQELAASTDEATASAAMHVVASQARFMQQMRRMELPLTELPAELFHACTQSLLHHPDIEDGLAQKVVSQMRATFDESQHRIGQVTRLLIGLGSEAMRALAVNHAGLSIFATALAMASEQDRDVVVLSLGENQCARLALSLRAAGLDQGEVEEQFVYLHPEISLPDGFDRLLRDQAAALLSSSTQETVK